MQQKSKLRIHEKKHALCKSQLILSLTWFCTQTYHKSTGIIIRNIKAKMHRTYKTGRPINKKRLSISSYEFPLFLCIGKFDRKLMLLLCAEVNRLSVTNALLFFWTTRRYFFQFEILPHLSIKILLNHSTYKFVVK